MQRRAFIAIAVGLVPSAGRAQSSFVGQWQGEVEGIGKARLVITAVKPGGQVEGRIEFELQSYVATFGDKADSSKNTAYGVASGSALTIDAALGGKYELVLDGGKLTGTYSRGTTFRGKAGFSKS